MAWQLSLIGMGTGHPDHLTRQAEAALRAADLVLIPHKEDAPDLARVRLEICQRVLGAGARLAVFDVPPRPRHGSDYLADVQRWHDAVAACWQSVLQAHLPAGGRAAWLIWGDPTLYDSSLRLAQRLARQMSVQVEVVPGVSAFQVLAAAHALPLNELNAPVLLTTGRRLRERGWPADADTLCVFLDGQCAFTALDARGVSIWWGAYLGWPQQQLIAGPLARVAPDIVAALQRGRQAHGWIMDTYILKRHQGEHAHAD